VFAPEKLFRFLYRALMARQLLKSILKSRYRWRFSDASSMSRGAKATKAGKLPEIGAQVFALI
jgi:hypothetical protein